MTQKLIISMITYLIISTIIGLVNNYIFVILLNIVIGLIINCFSKNNDKSFPFDFGMWIISSIVYFIIH